jgi:hypothetical protein
VAHSAAVEHAVLGDQRAEPVGERVDDRRAHAARGRTASDDHRVDATVDQRRDQWRAEERARLCLADQDIASLRRDLVRDRLTVVGRFQSAWVFVAPAAGMGDHAVSHTGRVVDRRLDRPAALDERADRLQCTPACLAT